MSFFVYMLITTNKVKFKTYVGYTKNLKIRLLKHNTNKGAKATKGYKWDLIYKKRFMSKSEAMSYEYFLKKNRTKRLTIIRKHLNEQ
ncbi:GIY-YIG nuclease family protein [Candidatus Pelagibacter sp.]|nr:GIY-YIG nuclease family protein [Candidatus Pelagibacter sp.]